MAPKLWNTRLTKEGARVRVHCERGNCGRRRTLRCSWRGLVRATGRARHGGFHSFSRIQASQPGIGKVVADDFPEAGAGFGHCFCTALAETDTVSLSDTLQNHFSLFVSCGEIIARHRVPTETSVDGKTSCFAFAEQARRFVLRNPPRPAGRILITVIAVNRKIGITTAGNAEFCRSARAAAATAREHGGDGLLREGNHKAARRGRCDAGRAFRIRRITQKLTVREIAEIKVVMAALSCGEVGARDDRLGL
jgi:hypothetical protein